MIHNCLFCVFVTRNVIALGYRRETPLNAAAGAKIYYLDLLQNFYRFSFVGWCFKTNLCVLFPIKKKKLFELFECCYYQVSVWLCPTAIETY